MSIYFQNHCNFIQILSHVQIQLINIIGEALWFSTEQKYEAKRKMPEQLHCCTAQMHIGGLL